MVMNTLMTRGMAANYPPNSNPGLVTQGYVLQILVPPQPKPRVKQGASGGGTFDEVFANTVCFPEIGYPNRECIPILTHDPIGEIAKTLIYPEWEKDGRNVFLDELVDELREEVNGEKMKSNNLEERLRAAMSKLEQEQGLNLSLSRRISELELGKPVSLDISQPILEQQQSQFIKTGITKKELILFVILAILATILVIVLGYLIYKKLTTRKPAPVIQTVEPPIRKTRSAFRRRKKKKQVSLRDVDED